LDVVGFDSPENGANEEFDFVVEDVYNGLVSVSVAFESN
jgi:hypothetical protein